jgi:hypothetical protein
MPIQVPFSSWDVGAAVAAGATKAVAAINIIAKIEMTFFIKKSLLFRYCFTS